jgi:hypothetical protein
MRRLARCKSLVRADRKKSPTIFARSALRTMPQAQLGPGLPSYNDEFVKIHLREAAKARGRELHANGDSGLAG